MQKQQNEAEFRQPTIGVDSWLGSRSSRAAAVRTQLQPTLTNRKLWWENFWRSQPDRFGTPSERVLRLVDKHTKIQTGLEAIDIGSGNGRYAIELGRRGMSTTALEWTSSGCKLIAANARAHNLTVNLVKEDFVGFQDYSQQYDLVFSSGLLEELEIRHHLQAITNIVLLTKHNGLIILKYCIAVGGRGLLVEDNSVKNHFDKLGVSVLYSQSDSDLRYSKSDMNIMTSTVVGRRVA